MAIRLLASRLALRVGPSLAWGLAVAAGLFCALPAAPAQGSGAFALDSSHAPQERSHPDRFPDKPSVPPAFTIPVEPLGFSPPGPIYLGERVSLASLDFIDENRLLFTFRVPGLIRREPQAGQGQNSEEHHIRAVVLALPAGAVQAEALWTLHDRSRYLWMLRDGHFLLRDGDELRQGDATLELKPYLRFPGPLLSLELDPAQQFLVTSSREPATAAPKPGEVPRPATAAADVVPHDDAPQSALPPNVVVRILRRDSGQVMLVSHVRSAVHLPINSDGYLESLRSRGLVWLLNLNYFSGGVTTLGQVESACTPTYDFVSQRELLITTCTRSGEPRLVAMSTNGRRLWEDRTSAVPVWPLLIMGPDGSRLARESLAVTHAVTAYSPLGADEIKGQLVEVFDAANGNVALAAAASPVLDAGGNVAISPSGRRVAVLNGGAIQVFDLPAPPPLPEAVSQGGR